MLAEEKRKLELEAARIRKTALETIHTAGSLKRSGPPSSPVRLDAHPLFAHQGQVISVGLW